MTDPTAFPMDTRPKHAKHAEESSFQPVNQPDASIISNQSIEPFDRLSSPPQPPSLFISADFSQSSKSSTSGVSTTRPSTFTHQLPPTRRRTRKPPAPPPPPLAGLSKSVAESIGTQSQTQISAINMRNVATTNSNSSSLATSVGCSTCSFSSLAFSSTSGNVSGCVSTAVSQPVSACNSLQRRRKSIKSRPAPLPPSLSVHKSRTNLSSLNWMIVDKIADVEEPQEEPEEMDAPVRPEVIDQDVALTKTEILAEDEARVRVVQRIHHRSTTTLLGNNRIRLGRSLSEATKLNAKQAFSGIQHCYNSESKLQNKYSWFDQPLQDASPPTPPLSFAPSPPPPMTTTTSTQNVLQDASSTPSAVNSLLRCQSLPELLYDDLDSEYSTHLDRLTFLTHPVTLKALISPVHRSTIVSDESKNVCESMIIEAVDGPKPSDSRLTTPPLPLQHSCTASGDDFHSDTSDGKVTVKSIPIQSNCGVDAFVELQPALQRPPRPPFSQQPAIVEQRNYWTNYEITLRQLQCVKERLLQDCWLLQRESARCTSNQQNDFSSLTSYATTAFPLPPRQTRSHLLRSTALFGNNFRSSLLINNSIIGRHRSWSLANVKRKKCRLSRNRSKNQIAGDRCKAASVFVAQHDFISHHSSNSSSSSSGSNSSGSSGGGDISSGDGEGGAKRLLTSSAGNRDNAGQCPQCVRLVMAKCGSGNRHKEVDICRGESKHTQFQVFV